MADVNVDWALLTSGDFALELGSEHYDITRKVIDIDGNLTLRGAGRLLLEDGWHLSCHSLKLDVGLYPNARNVTASFGTRDLVVSGSKIYSLHLDGRLLISDLDGSNSSALTLNGGATATTYRKLACDGTHAYLATSSGVIYKHKVSDGNAVESGGSAISYDFGSAVDAMGFFSTSFYTLQGGSVRRHNRTDSDFGTIQTTYTLGNISETRASDGLVVTAQELYVSNTPTSGYKKIYKYARQATATQQDYYYIPTNIAPVGLGLYNNEFYVGGTGGYIAVFNPFTTVTKTSPDANYNLILNDSSISVHDGDANNANQWQSGSVRIRRGKIHNLSTSTSGQYSYGSYSVDHQIMYDIEDLDVVSNGQRTLSQFYRATPESSIAGVNMVNGRTDINFNAGGHVTGVAVNPRSTSNTGIETNDVDVTNLRAGNFDIFTYYDKWIFDRVDNTVGAFELQPRAAMKVILIDPDIRNGRVINVKWVSPNNMTNGNTMWVSARFRFNPIITHPTISTEGVKVYIKDVDTVDGSGISTSQGTVYRETGRTVGSGTNSGDNGKYVGDYEKLTGVGGIAIETIQSSGSFTNNLLVQTRWAQGTSTASTTAFAFNPVSSSGWYMKRRGYRFVEEEGRYQFETLLRNPRYTLVEDTLISEETRATVAAYTEIANWDQLYDYIKYKRSDYEEAPDLPTESAGSLVFGFNLVLDATATDVWSYNSTTNTLTVKAPATFVNGTKFVKGKTTGTITKTGNVDIRATVEDSTGIDFLFRSNVAGTRVCWSKDDGENISFVTLTDADTDYKIRVLSTDTIKALAKAEGYHASVQSVVGSHGVINFSLAEDPAVALENSVDDYNFTNSGSKVKQIYLDYNVDTKFREEDREADLDSANTDPVGLFAYVSGAGNTFVVVYDDTSHRLHYRNLSNGATFSTPVSALASVTVIDTDSLSGNNHRFLTSTKIVGSDGGDIVSSFDASNNNPTAFCVDWIDSRVYYVAQSGGDIFAYGEGVRFPTLDIEHATGNDNIVAMAYYKGHIYAVDGTDDKVYVYKEGDGTATAQHVPSMDFDLPSGIDNVASCYIVDSVMYLVDSTDLKVYAINILSTHIVVGQHNVFDNPEIIKRMMDKLMTTDEALKFQFYRRGANSRLNGNLYRINLSSIEVDTDEVLYVRKSGLLASDGSNIGLRHLGNDNETIAPPASNNGRVTFAPASTHNILPLSTVRSTAEALADDDTYLDGIKNAVGERVLDDAKVTNITNKVNRLPEMERIETNTELLVSRIPLDPITRQFEEIFDVDLADSDIVVNPTPPNAFLQSVTDNAKGIEIVFRDHNKSGGFAYFTFENVNTTFTALDSESLICEMWLRAENVSAGSTRQFVQPEIEFDFFQETPNKTITPRVHLHKPDLLIKGEAVPIVFDFGRIGGHTINTMELGIKLNSSDTDRVKLIIEKLTMYKITSRSEDDFKADLSGISGALTTDQANAVARITEARMGKLDDLTFNSDNRVEADIKQVDGDIVDSVDDFKGSGGGTGGLTTDQATQLSNLNTRITDTRAGNLDNLDTTVSSRSSQSTQDTIDSNLDSVKTQTDKINFNSDNDVKATLDGESVGATVDISGLATQASVDTIDANVDAIKTETDKIQTVDDNLDAVKTKTDSLNFTGDDVKATLDSEEVDIGKVKGTAVSSVDDFKATSSGGGSGLTTDQATQLSNLNTRLTDTRAGNLDNLDASISTRATQTSLNAVKTVADAIKTVVDAIKTVTDKFGFTSDNDVKATLDSEEVDIGSVKGTAVDGVADFQGTTTSENNSALTTTQANQLANLNSRLTDARATNLDNLDATVSSRATQTSVDTIDSNVDAVKTETDKIQTIDDNVDTVNTATSGIKTQTDKLGFNSDNDVKATLDGEEVTTDTASRNASKADVSGISVTAPTVTEIREEMDSNSTKLANLDDTITSRASQTSVNTVDGIADSIKTETDKIQTIDDNVDAVKTKTDGLNFTGDDVKATIDSEEVNIGQVKGTDVTSVDDFKGSGSGSGLTTDQATQLSNLNTRITDARATNLDNLDTTVSSRSSQTSVDTIDTNVDAIKSTADRIAFNSDNDVIATLDSEEVDIGKVKGTAVDGVADFQGTTTSENNSALTTTQANQLANLNSRLTDARATNLDNLDATVSSRGSDTDLTAVKTQTDKMQFTDANDIKSTLDGEEVTTDSASRTASKADVSSLATQSSVDTIDTVVDAVKAVADKFNFNGDNDVKATLDSEEVTTDSASRTASKSDVSNLATQASVDTIGTNVDAIKTKTDGLNFTGDDVKATLDGEEVTTDSASRIASQTDVSGLASQSSVDTIDSNVDAIKTETDKIQTIDDNVDSIKTDTEIVKKTHTNRHTLDRTTGVRTVYDDDNNTVLYKKKYTDDVGDPDVDNPTQEAVES